MQIKLSVILNTESNVNVGTDSSQEATKSSDSEKSVHELG